MTEEINYEAVNEVYRRFGMKPVHPAYPKTQRHYSLSDQAVQGLESIATRENLTSDRGRTAGFPSVAELLECIGLGIYDVVLRTPNQQ